MRIIEPYIVLEDNIDGEKILKKIEKIGRVCYKSENNIKEGSAEKFVSNILHRHHESVLEHVSISVRVICDRGVSHEIVRHRLASYSQESSRYCVAGDTILNFKNSHQNMTIEELYNNKLNSTNGVWKRFKIKQLNEDTGEIVYSNIKNVLFNGEKEIYQIKTSLGYILKCTEDHKIYTPNGYKKLQELSIGNDIYINGVELSTEKLYKNKDWLYYQNITLNKTFKTIADEFKYNISTIKKWARKFDLPQKGSGYFNIGRKPWNKGLNEEDDIRVKKQAEALRKYHYDSSKKGQKIMKEDTCKYHKHIKSQCELCSTESNLEVHHKDVNRENNHPDNLITLCKSCHGRVHSKNLLFIHTDKIVSIEKIGIRKVYDLEMNSKFHNYSANGIIVHNCNYSNDKFGNELTFIKPCWFKSSVEDLNEYCNTLTYKSYKNLARDELNWSHLLIGIEDNYFILIDEDKWTPEQARSILPNSVKTEIVMTMNLREWRHFFNMRCSVAAHPQMRQIANMILDTFRVNIPIIFDDIEKVKEI